MNQSQNFHQQCYALIRSIPQGRVTTYKEIAHALGTKAYRAVGTAMTKNSDLVHTPCHRVVRSDGTIGQYVLGAEKKAALLRSEGVELSGGKIKDFERVFYRFNNV